MGLQTRVTLSRPGLLKGIRDRLLHPRPLMTAVGVSGMGAMHRQLIAGLKMEDAGIRTGRLTGSLLVHGPGQGTDDSVFDVSDFRAEVGTNVPYAAQVNFGGAIRPRTAKALAIPLTDKLKRSGLWPRDIDPGRDKLQLIPCKSGDGAVLLDPTGELGYGTKPLFALKSQVYQEGKHFARWDEQARRDNEHAFNLWWRGALS